MSKREVTNLLNAILKALKELDEAEYKQVLDGKGRIQFTGLEYKDAGRRKKGKALTKTKLTVEELHVLASQLQTCQTREEARELLYKGDLTLLKENLTQLARLLGIHVDKNDRNKTIEHKIVESVVGVRLRSEAIRSLNLKGS